MVAPHSMEISYSTIKSLIVPTQPTQLPHDFHFYYQYQFPIHSQSTTVSFPFPLHCLTSSQMTISIYITMVPHVLEFGDNWYHPWLYLTMVVVPMPMTMDVWTWLPPHCAWYMWIYPNRHIYTNTRTLVWHLETSLLRVWYLQYQFKEWDQQWQFSIIGVINVIQDMNSIHWLEHEWMHWILRCKFKYGTSINMILSNGLFIYDRSLANNYLTTVQFSLNSRILTTLSGSNKSMTGFAY